MKVPVAGAIGFTALRARRLLEGGISVKALVQTNNLTYRLRLFAEGIMPQITETGIPSGRPAA